MNMVRTEGINEPDSFGFYPLHWAVCTPTLIMRGLLERGADPNVFDAMGETPLGRARRLNKKAMTQILLQHGARAYSVEHQQQLRTLRTRPELLML